MLFFCNGYVYWGFTAEKGGKGVGAERYYFTRRDRDNGETALEVFFHTAKQG